MKQWKKCLKDENLVYSDIGARDGPCILHNNNLMIGTYDDSHSTLVHKLLYGMDFSNHPDQGDWSHYVEMCKDQGLFYTRDNIEDEDVVYGAIHGNIIVWEDNNDIPYNELKKRILNLKHERVNYISRYNGIEKKYYLIKI